MLANQTNGHACLQRLLAATAIAAALCAPVSSSADTLDFQAASVSEAVSRIDQTFHVTLELKKGVDTRRKVTFSVENPGGDGALLDAVNSLANALNADYQKVFLLTNTAPGAAAQDPAIDAADAPIVFSSRTLPAAKAIALIAGVDAATVQTPASLESTITFSDASLTAGEAARQAARQTHTEWKVSYILTPHTTQGVLPGKVIGYTGAGRPILEMPNLTFRTAKPAPLESTDPIAQQNRAASYWSALRRGDQSAMLKFRGSGGAAGDPAPPPRNP
ncbi:hypothetical protein CCAX7_003290 [Capsulimonas corticalis]|uniref:Uncharacterized protein n=1 Tax=Capsulimonas corticalis TaxID=2219043 RepID=A0A402CS74_9BACT|nr:hypothetical protein [Capsulimonas corticalis]BDI28278.1 hypothetical protein CCAX7_003290 [Capsulimonas corticalis]